MANFMSPDVMSYYSINYNHHLQAAEISFDQEHICWRAKTTDEYKSNNFFYDPCFDGLSIEEKIAVLSSKTVCRN